ncbi:hypothetical protein P692DRAFT_20734343, partial [Suillus brevipes Sb2]
MTIPRSSSKKVWCLFALAHFKPFGLEAPLLRRGEDIVDAYEKYTFSPRAREIMVNWEAVHECEDERDADRLRKRAQLSVESKALTSSLALSLDDDGLDTVTLPPNSSRRAEDDFRIQQTVLLLQQSNWLARKTPTPVELLSKPDPASSDSVSPSAQDATPACKADIKQWLREIKMQEEAIAHARKNALNP